MSLSEAKNLEELDEFELDKDLEIDVSSPHVFEKVLIAYPMVRRKYDKWAAQAEKEVQLLELELKVLEAELAEELTNKFIENNGKEPTATWSNNLSKHLFPKDKRWYKVSKRIAIAKSNKLYINGLVKSHDAKGFSLNNLTRLLEKTFIPDSGFFSPDINKDINENLIKRGRKKTEKVQLDEACGNLELNIK